MSAEGIAWRRVSRGLYLIGLGILLLLNTQGFLPWSFWLDAASYWPVLLVAIGVRLIFERTRVRWGILLSPLLVFGMLATVAVEGASFPGDWRSLRVERPPEARRLSLEAELVGARLEVRARDLEDGLLLDGGTGPDRGQWLRQSGSGQSVRVRLGNAERRRHLRVVWPRRAELWNLAVSPALPLDVDLELAFTDGLLDLAGAAVSRVSLEGAFHEITLRLGAPESDVPVRVEGAFGRLRLEVPESTPVRVHTEGFLNLVNGRSGAGALDGPAYDLTLEGAFNRLEVVSR